MRTESMAGAAPPPEFESFRREESALILFNLAVVAVLLLVHVSFVSVLGRPNRPLLLTLFGYFLVLVVELAWVRTSRVTLSPSAVRAFSAASVWIGLVFVTLATFVGDVEDRHYSVLLVLPVVSAAFRFSLAGTLGVATLAGALNFLEVVWYYSHHPPHRIGEYLEAFGVSLILFVVGVVVRQLVWELRREESKLRRSLAELAGARDRLVAEEKLAVVGRLASAIAHEIRNPVAVISSALASATEGRAEPARRAEMLRIASSESKRLETLTTEFLAYASPRKPEARPASVATTLGYVADLVRARAGPGGRRVAVDCPDDLRAFMDPFQIQQALLNLGLNALEATGAAGLVALGARAAEGGGCELFVENDGDPIAPDAVSRVFEPFFTTKPGGTGLGLAVARNIARAHGGDARLEANEPGRVRFAILLPGAR